MTGCPLDVSMTTKTSKAAPNRSVAKLRVLLLGGTSEIGLAIAKTYLKHHRGENQTAELILATRQGSKYLPATLEDLAKYSAWLEVSVVDLDATDLASHQPTISKIFAQGKISLAILAFGVGGARDQVTNVELIHQIFQTNATGAVSVAAATVNELERQGGGILVGLSSVAAVRVRPTNLIYGAAKSGFDNYLANLQPMLKNTSILLVRPGQVATKMSAQLPKVALATTAEKVAEQTLVALNRLENNPKPRLVTMFSPAIFGPITTCYRLLPGRFANWLAKRLDGTVKNSR